MKILHVVPAIGPVYGGPSESVLKLAESLAQGGNQVDLVTTHANGNSKLDVPLNRWITNTQNNLRTKYFPYWYTGDYKFSLSLALWLLRHVPEYDVVNTHAIFSCSILPAYWACQIHKIPYVVHPHGMLETWALKYKAWKKRPYFNLIEKSALKRASAIRTLTTAEIENTRILNIKTAFACIPNAIQDENFNVQHDPNLFYEKYPDIRGKIPILFLGRIDPKKGLDLLARAFAKVHAQFPQTHLIIAGPDNIGFLPSVQSYFAQAGCLNAVTFTGMLTGAIKYAALAASSLYVAPSYSEGFSMSVLEGMASGLPCIITTACNFPEAAAAEAAYVVNIDADEIARALIECLNDPQQAKTVGDRARKLVFDEYTWDRIASKLLQVYTGILKQESLPAFD